MFRFVIWLTRQLRSRHRSADAPMYAGQDSPSELVTVRLPDGQLMEGQRTGPPPLKSSWR